MPKGDWWQRKACVYLWDHIRRHGQEFHNVLPWLTAGRPSGAELWALEPQHWRHTGDCPATGLLHPNSSFPWHGLGKFYPSVRVASWVFLSNQPSFPATGWPWWLDRTGCVPCRRASRLPIPWTSVPCFVSISCTRTVRCSIVLPGSFSACLFFMQLK